MDPALQVPSQLQVKRRIKLIRPRLQLKLTAVFGGLLLLSLLTSMMLSGLLIARLSEALPSDSTLLIELLPGLLTRSLLVSLLFVLPALLLIGVRTTFRIAGPVHRLESHLGAVVAGLRPGPGQLREGDELQELCGLINQALDTARCEGMAEGESAQGGAGIKRAA